MSSNPQNKIKELLKLEESVCTKSEHMEIWKLPNGKIHRVHGPALSRSDGLYHWYLKGEIHREDGPAVGFSSGEVRWYIQGQEYLFEEEFLIALNDYRNSKLKKQEELSNRKKFKGHKK